MTMTVDAHTFQEATQSPRMLGTSRDHVYRGGRSVRGRLALHSIKVALLSVFKAFLVQFIVFGNETHSIENLQQKYDFYKCLKSRQSSMQSLGWVDLCSVKSQHSLHTTEGDVTNNQNPQHSIHHLTYSQ